MQSIGEDEEHALALPPLSLIVTLRSTALVDPLEAAIGSEAAIGAAAVEVATACCLRIATLAQRLGEDLNSAVTPLIAAMNRFPASSTIQAAALEALAYLCLGDSDDADAKVRLALAVQANALVATITAMRTHW